MSAATSTAPVSQVRPSGLPSLSVEREDIVFGTLRPGRLFAEITIHNTGEERSETTVAVLQSAPLGVFVPWQPLGVIRVPSLAPGGSTTIREEFTYTTPQVLGSIDKLPPERLLTALGLGEPDKNTRQPAPPQNPSLVPALLALLQQGGAPPAASADQQTPATDLLALVQQGSPHWAGNLNLFFPGADVERHVAQALRVYPGRVNLAMFIIGKPRDIYQFHFSGDAADWNARLFDTFHGRPILEGIHSPEVEEGVWHQPSTGLVLLMVVPPPEAETGAVNVHVRQKSSNREAVVEFTMDSRAAGPGCYKL